MAFKITVISAKKNADGHLAITAEYEKVILARQEALIPSFEFMQAQAGNDPKGVSLFEFATEADYLDAAMAKLTAQLKDDSTREPDEKAAMTAAGVLGRVVQI